MTNPEIEKVEIRVVSSRNVEWFELCPDGYGNIRRSSTLAWNDELNRYDATVMMGDTLTHLIGYFPKDEAAV